MAAFTKRRGDTWVFDLPLTQPGGATPFDLSGSTVRVTFKANANLADDADGVFQYHWTDGGTSSGITVADPADGDVVVKVPSSDTEDFRVVTYHYDVQVTDANSETWTPDDGTVKVVADITKTVP